MVKIGLWALSIVFFPFIVMLIASHYLAEWFWRKM